MNPPELHKALVRCGADLEKYIQAQIRGTLFIERHDLEPHYINHYPNADGVVFVFSNRNAALMFKLALS